MKSALFLYNFSTKKACQKNSFVSDSTLENSKIRFTLIHEGNLYSCRASSDLRDHPVQTSCFTNEETGLEVKVRLMFKED